MNLQSKILVIDDQISFLDIIVEIFMRHKLPYDIFRTTNPEKALKLASEESPDLIITDWEMPMLSGIDLIRKFKGHSTTADIPIIMCTGVMIGPENLKIALEAGATDYINKPIDETELIARTQSILKIAHYQKQILEQKNRELAENSMYLVKNNEFMIKIIDDLQFLSKNKDNSEKISTTVNKILESIESKVKEDSWKRFDIYFERVHHGFQKNLSTSYPSLLPHELRLCTFLRLGMNSKDIASVTFQSIDSVKVLRSRLRKKFEIGRDVNLITFLSSF
ncbi:MAG: response regulator [Bacteroidales bacterium]|nr:response regulator [Bacteroidales bacterium]